MNKPVLANRCVLERNGRPGEPVVGEVFEALQPGGGASQGCVEGREEGKWADLRIPQRKRQIQEAITQLAGGGRAGQGWALRTLRSEGDYLRPGAWPQASTACPPFWGWGVGERRDWKRREGKLGL